MWPGITLHLFLFVWGTREVHSMSHDMMDPEHGIIMGVPWKPCDDGVDGIEIDWDPSSDAEIACYTSEANWFTNEAFENAGSSITPYMELQEKSDEHSIHVCLNESITYDKDIPLSGNHRPLWPKFGTYKYLPPQRWVHSLEHGAIVLLYHPCMEETLSLDELKSIVRGCLRKHVITPYRKIPDRYPFAVVAYGNAIVLSHFSNTSIQRNQLVSFIKEHALQAPESRVFRDGQYDIGLLKSADIVSDKTDFTLCPHI